MSEALLFGPYGDLRTFVHRGVARGEHRTLTSYRNPEEMDYRAEVHVAGLLPVSRVVPRISTQAAPGDVRVFGPRVEVEALKGTPLSARTTGWEFFDALLKSKPARQTIARVEKHLRNLTVQPLPDGTTRLLVTITNASNVDVLEDAIQFVHSLTDAADAIVDRQAAFEDCAEMLARLGQQKDQVDDRDAVSDLLENADAATAWMSGRCERIGDDVVCHVRLPSDVAPLEGEIRLALWRQKDEVRLRVAADLALPEVDALVARLDLEEPGVVGWFKRLGEIEIGESDVDDMFRIFAAPDVAPVLVHAKDSLLALGRAGATVRLSALRLVVAADDVRQEAPTFARTLESVGILWREVAVWRAGILAPDRS